MALCKNQRSLLQDNYLALISSDSRNVKSDLLRARYSGNCLAAVLAAKCISYHCLLFDEDFLSNYFSFNITRFLPRDYCGSC